MDASGSTLRGGALARAKGAAVAALRAAYLRRWQAALVLCQGGEARLLHPPRRPPKDPTPWLAPVRGGGGTPLIPALRQAARLLAAHARHHPHGRRRLLVLSDGHARLAGVPPPLPAQVQVVQTVRGARAGGSRRLAAWLGATHWLATGDGPSSGGHSV